MKIINAFPDLFARNVPSVEPDTSNLTAITILRSTDLEVLPVQVGPPKVSETEEAPAHHYAISGYSIISRLVETEPKNYERFLSAPCSNSALLLGVVPNYESDILSLLHVFEASTFGFALVETAGQGDLHGLISIRDLLNLYLTGGIACDLSVNDVSSSPVFSVPRDSLLKKTLKEMIRRKFRRVLITGTGEIFTDKQIIGYVFKEDRMRRISEEPEHLLDGTVGDLDSEEVTFVSENRSLREAAATLLHSRQSCLLTAKGIVTPWDLIMKPWRLGSLRIRE